MSKQKKLLLIVLLFLLVLGGAYTLYNRLGSDMSTNALMATPTPAPTADSASGADPAAPSPTPAPTPEPLPAPDFTAYLADGTEVKLSDYFGKPIVINFWATWCPYCLMEMPLFQDIQDSMGEDVHVLMVNVTDGYEETLSNATAYIGREGFTFPVLYDTTLDASMKYGASSLPITYFINAEGKVAAGHRGIINGELLQLGIDMIHPAD